MFNAIGKGLVVVHTALSLMLLGWAATVYFQFTDLGWKEPYKVWESKDAGRRIPSELDKRTAALHELYRARDRVLPAIKPALDSLNETMERFPRNHLFYVAELDKIRKSDQPIQPKALKWAGGTLVLETPGKLTGKPAMTDPLPGIDKSLKTYKEEQRKLQNEIERLTPEVEELVKKGDEITVQLYGVKDDKGNSVDIGLYEILENEKKLQDKIAAEKETITPIYVDAQRRTESYYDRLRSMQRTLDTFAGKK